VYEAKLNACGYKGNLPYWEWGLDAQNMTASPVFDGSDLSLGGDGDYVPHEGMILQQVGVNLTLPLPPGTGGGCVTKGPFGNLTIRLGPVVLPQYGSATVISAANPLGDNLRCLRRDLNSKVAERFSKFSNSTSLLLDWDSVEYFQAYMQGDTNYLLNEVGVHGGGHFAIGGDPGSDAFISPGDPAFYLHHGQVDRLYWMWQMQDFDNRQDVFGTLTFNNQPPSANVTVDDYIDIAPLTQARAQIKDLMNTVGGTPLCYVYE
jgi:tyrosinase